MSKTERHGKPGGMTVDTDHGVYDAMPWRESDDGPANALLTVFRDGGSLAGYVTRWGGAYAAFRADDRGVCGARFITVTGTLAGATGRVADRDRGLAS
jgi:hypothetical protein